MMPPVTNINQLDLYKVYSYADYLTWKFQDRLELLKNYKLFIIDDVIKGYYF